MKNIRLVVAYDGTNYGGFQIQPNAVTIQGCLEEALTRLAKEPLRVIGAGRTDSGVHAEGQIVNFHSDLSVPTKKLPQAINRVLPEDIRILQATNVDPAFHARYSAIGKTYRYQIINKPIPNLFMRNYSWWIRKELRWDLVERASHFLVGELDFASFAASGSSAKTTVRNLEKISFTTQSDLTLIHFRANGFLYNMVRNLVGTLMEVGKGKILPEDIPRILALRDRTAAGPTAPPHGLFLEEVHY